MSVLVEYILRRRKSDKSLIKDTAGGLERRRGKLFIAVKFCRNVVNIWKQNHQASVGSHK